ncbi:hypothetical protein AXX12_08270 [Anaerosporomusa subterranea]|uniref:D-glucuronyl C5-epimerase C-terminal domain-containing protein n=1 Tax=Anaerosporomusa subterranea TaxID=1794912 RepID=A0A154BR95_ANASB|nr:D-glucuronyl C5-epimerase family protein [Anaerosporomusa subterranea]KYZ76419.1 hypothetical protein AXX12_08270 [Anaerosporomusa subterranea]
MHKKTIAKLLIVISILLIPSVIYILYKKPQETKTIIRVEKPIPVLSYSDKVYLPYENFRYIDQSQEISRLYGEGTEFIDPWLEGTAIITAFNNGYRNNDSNSYVAGLKRLDKVLAVFDKKGAWPHPQYGSYPDGWVSSMDAPVIALCSQAAYEITGEKKYIEYRERIVRHMLKTVKEGSFILPLKNGTQWLAEYAYPLSTEENEYYVLNGFLVGLQSILMLANATADEELYATYDKALLAYKKLAPGYWYKSFDWSYYMLNPLTIIEPHYMIYETKQLDALYTLHSDNFYDEEATKHRIALTKILPLYAVDNQYYLLRAGAPHPYYIDIFLNTIEFYDDQGNITGTIKSNRTGSFFERAFMQGSIPANTKGYHMYSHNGSDAKKYYLFSAPIRQIKSDDQLKPSKIDYTTNGFNDAIPVAKNEFSLKREVSSSDEGTIVIELDKPLQKSVDSFWGIEITSAEEALVYIVLFDNQGNTAHRYYRPLVQGKNLLLLHSLGFNNFENLKGDINKVRISIFTETEVNKHNKSDWMVEINGVYNYPTSASAFMHLKGHPDLIINEQK